MQWRGRRQSTNIEDRRGQTGGSGLGGGRSRIPFNIPIGSGGGLGRAGGGGIGILIIAVVAMLIFGINPLDLLNGGSSTSQVADGGQAQGQVGAPADEGGQFVATVLADTEDTWSQIFQQSGQTYPPPTLVLFNGSTSSACGFASAATGPFYCPADRKLYIDLAFYDELKGEFGAPGDFAQAYVIAHEVGHHIQNLTGSLENRANAQRGESENQASVRVELQADCYAGVWANRTEARLPFLDQGDIEEALNAASKIGDDSIQKRTQGYVVPESFNHGSSAQRVSWFRRGYTEGRVAACDTFTGPI